MSGELKKLRIHAYSDENFENEVRSETFTVQLNPESYTRRYKVEYGDQQSPGTSGQDLNFVRIAPQTLELEFLFDQTGAIPGSSKPALGVDEDINRLKSTTLQYRGEIHRPYYLKVSWGNLLFKCCLESMDISYKLFRSDGAPVRASVKLGFKEFSENELMVREQNDNSPDLTHVRTVNEGDTLPGLAWRIYGDPKYYIELARFNGLTHFRELEVGSKIYLPPIAK